MKPKPTITEVAPGRTMLLLDGKPALVKFAGREAQSAPSGTRIKGVLALDFGGQISALPFAGVGKHLTPEFRLEMN